MDPSRDARRPGGNRSRGDRPAAETRRAPRHPRGLPRAYECDGWHGAARGDGRGGPPPWLRVRRDFGPLRVRDRRWRDDRGTSAVAPRPRPGPQSGTEWLHNPPRDRVRHPGRDRKSTRLNSSHLVISYAVFCLKKKNVLIRDERQLHFIQDFDPALEGMG